METIKGYFIQNKWIIVFFLMFPFFNDGYILFDLLNGPLMDVLKIISFLWLFVLFCRNKKQFSRMMIILLLMEIWWVISTLFNYSLREIDVYYKLSIDIINALSVALCVELFKDDPDSLLKGLMLNMELALYPNLVTVFMNYPGERVYLLGGDTVFILWLLPAFTIACLYILFSKKYLRSTVLIVVCLITLLKAWCATAIASFLGMFFVLGSGLLLYKKTKVSLAALLLVSFFINLFILFVYSGGNFPLLDFVIEKILQRSTTFTERTIIWKEAIRMIKEKPFIGHGFRTQINVSNSFADHFLHSHNQILQRLNATGIIGFLLFFGFHAELCKKTDHIENSLERLITIAAVFAISITYIAEAYIKFFRLYLVFFIAYHIRDMMVKKRNEKGLS